MFFFAQSENEQTVEVFSAFFEPETNEMEAGNLLAEDAAMVRNERQNKWGWLLIAKNVADWQNTNIKDVLKSNCYEVLTYATLVKDEVDFIQAQHTSNGR